MFESCSCESWSCESCGPDMYRRYIFTWGEKHMPVSQAGEKLGKYKWFNSIKNNEFGYQSTIDNELPF